MTETETPRDRMPRMVVLGVQSGDPPYRLVEIGGEFVGTAHSLADVLEIAHRAGLGRLDLDDPDQVRWVGGDKYTWTTWHW